jgi:septal ring factor EnvC (AmiA/AmiB activator)
VIACALAWVALGAPGGAAPIGSVATDEGTDKGLAQSSAVDASELRSDIAQQLADEAATIDRTLATVIEKLATADLERSRRLAGAYRALRTPANDPASSARRRAAVRMLVSRDLFERQLLADELAQLEAAKLRVGSDRKRVAELALPIELERPAKGTIARRFGMFDHDRSRTKLSRRGIDIEVEPTSLVVAPADGVVRYAGPIRGLDNGIVIDHGNVFTVTAKLGELSVPMGVPVKRGDRIGRAARHRVYVEVRAKIGAGGLPIDPEPLFDRKR